MFVFGLGLALFLGSFMCSETIGCCGMEWLVLPLALGFAGRRAVHLPGAGVLPALRGLSPVRGGAL